MPTAIAASLLAAVVTSVTTVSGMAAQGDQVAEITMTEYAFGPNESAVSAGTTRLQLVNAGIRRHNLVILIDGIEQASPEVRPGDNVEWELAIEHPGRYLFWCGEYRHLEKGMTGALVVEHPAASSQTDGGDLSELGLLAPGTLRSANSGSK